MPDTLPPFAERVRREDPERFFATLLAPAALRHALLLVAALDLELASVARRRTEMAGPFPALIRLQWWRDVIEGRAADPQHELAAPLRAALDDEHLSAADLLRMLDGREAEAEGVADWPAWREAMLQGAGGASVATGRLLHVADPERLAVIGAGRECLLTRPDAAFLPDGASADELDGAGRRLLAEADGIGLPRSQRAVLLPAIAALRSTVRPPGIGAQIAMLSAWLFGGSFRAS